MNLDIIIAWFLSLAIGFQIILGIAIYLTAVMALYGGVWFFFGHELAERVCVPFALPTRILFWPFNYRRNRLFQEEFGMHPDDCEEETVFYHLRELAVEMQDSFDAQLLARKTFLARIRTERELDEANAAARNDKAHFWRAHKLAKDAGFGVEDKYANYLTDAYKQNRQPRMTRVEQRLGLPSYPPLRPLPERRRVYLPTATRGDII